MIEQIKGNFVKKNALTRTLKMILGILISTVGTAIFLHLDWGSSPISTGAQGLSVATGISLGQANAALNVVSLAIILLTVPGLIGMGTILAPAVFSLSIDAQMDLFSHLQIPEMDLPMKVVMLLVASLLSGIGTGYYVAQDYGTGAIDGLTIMLNRKFDVPIVYGRWALDGFQVLIGALLGAAWGVGTIASLILVSPVMNFVIQHVKSDYGDRVEKPKRPVTERLADDGEHNLPTSKSSPE